MNAASSASSALSAAAANACGLGDLTFELVEAQADELERIEHEALVEARFQQREARARRVGRGG